MDSKIDIVCDTLAESQFAAQYLTQRGYQNISTAETTEYHVVEIEGAPPNYQFVGKYTKMSAKLWIVSGEMP